MQQDIVHLKQSVASLQRQQSGASNRPEVVVDKFYPTFNRKEDFESFCNGLIEDEEQKQKLVC